jgi:hypothetical protein
MKYQRPTELLQESRSTVCFYGGPDKSLARPGRKQITAIEVFDFHTSYL